MRHCGVKETGAGQGLDLLLNLDSGYPDKAGFRNDTVDGLEIFGERDRIGGMPEQKEETPGGITPTESQHPSKGIPPEDPPKPRPFLHASVPVKGQSGSGWPSCEDFGE